MVRVRVSSLAMAAAGDAFPLAMRSLNVFDDVGDCDAREALSVHDELAALGGIAATHVLWPLRLVRAVAEASVKLAQREAWASEADSRTQVRGREET